MFPTMVSDPNDKNRRYTGEVGSQWPRPLKAGYVLALAVAVLLLVIAFLSLKAGTPQGIEPDVRDAFARNLRVYAWGNIILGACIASACAYLEKGSKAARRWASVFIGLAVFLQLSGFLVGVAGWAALVVVGLLVFALFFMFRPAANAYVDKRSGDVWEGVE